MQLPEVWTEEGAEDPVAVAAEVGYGKSGALSANSIDPPAAAAVAASGPPAAAAVAASGGVQPAGGNKGRGRREEVSGVGRYPGMDTPLPPLPPPTDPASIRRAVKLEVGLTRGLKPAEWGAGAGAAAGGCCGGGGAGWAATLMRSRRPMSRRFSVPSAIRAA